MWRKIFTVLTLKTLLNHHAMLHLGNRTIYLINVWLLQRVINCPPVELLLSIAYHHLNSSFIFLSVPGTFFGTQLTLHCYSLQVSNSYRHAVFNKKAKFVVFSFSFVRDLTHSINKHQVIRLHYYCYLWSKCKFEYLTNTLIANNDYIYMHQSTFKK